MSVLAPQRPGNKVIHAEGEAQAAEKLSEAANIISVYPAAIHLWFLQTIAKVAAEKNSTTILPFPIDILAASCKRRRRNNPGHILKNLFGKVILVSKAFTLLSASIRAFNFFPGQGNSDVALD